MFVTVTLAINKKGAAALAELNYVRLEAIAQGIRLRLLDHAQATKGIAADTASSASEIIAALYGGAINLASFDNSAAASPTVGKSALGETSENAADCLVISSVRYAPVVYAALVETGRLVPESPEQCSDGCTCIELVDSLHGLFDPGAPLAADRSQLWQAIDKAAGVAIARRLNNETGHTWVLISDRDIPDQHPWKVLSTLRDWDVTTVRVLVEITQRQTAGPVETVMGLEPIVAELEKGGADVAIVDGHDLPQLVEAIRRPGNRPHVVLAYTDSSRWLPMSTGESDRSANPAN